MKCTIICINISIYLFIKAEISLSIVDKSIKDPNALTSSASTLSASISTRTFGESFCNVLDTVFEIYVKKKVYIHKQL